MGSGNPLVAEQSHPRPHQGVVHRAGQEMLLHHCPAWPQEDESNPGFPERKDMTTSFPEGLEVLPPLCVAFGPWDGVRSGVSQP